MARAIVKLEAARGCERSVNHISSHRETPRSLGIFNPTCTRKEREREREGGVPNQRRKSRRLLCESLCDDVRDENTDGTNTKRAIAAWLLYRLEFCAIATCGMRFSARVSRALNVAAYIKTEKRRDQFLYGIRIKTFRDKSNNRNHLIAQRANNTDT